MSVDRTADALEHPTVKLRHPLAALAAAALAVAALTGCQTNVGTAAHIDDRSISASAIDDKLRTLSSDEITTLNEQSATPLTASSIAASARTIVVTFSVRDVVFGLLWDKRGGKPSTETLEGLHDRAIQYLLGSSSAPTGAEGDTFISGQLDSLGIDTDFGATMLHSTELLLALADEAGAQSDDEVVQAVNEAGIDVRVNPRYGTWDPATLSLGTTALPDYLVDADAPLKSDAPVAS